MNMFLEIKPYQSVSLNDVTGFAMYPGNDYNSKILYVHTRGSADRSLQFSFDTERDCKFAYNRLKKMLEKNGNIMENYKDDTYID